VSRKYIYIWILIAIVLLGSGALFFCLDNNDSKQNTIRVGYVKLGASLPLFTAVEKGYFKDKGLEVELYEFKSGNELAVAGSTGQIDVMATCATNAAIDAAGFSGADFRAFMSNGYIKGNGSRKSTDFLIAREHTPLESLRDKTIAFFPGSVSKVFADLVLAKYNLPPNSYKYVELSPTEWLPALKSGQIDAVMAVEPSATIILKSGGVSVLIDGFCAEVMPSVPLSAWWFTGKKLSKEREIDFVDSIKKSVAFIQENPAEAKRFLSSYTQLPQDIADSVALNEWLFTDETRCRDSLVELLAIFKHHRIVKDIPPEEKWLWNR